MEQAQMDPVTAKVKCAEAIVNALDQLDMLAAEEGKKRQELGALKVPDQLRWQADWLERKDAVVARIRTLREAWGGFGRSKA